MRATTNENVNTIFIAAISKNIAVFLDAVVHLTAPLNKFWTAIVFVIYNTIAICSQWIWRGVICNPPQHFPKEEDDFYTKKKLIEWFFEKQNPQLPFYYLQSTLVFEM